MKINKTTLKSPVRKLYDSYSAKEDLPVSVIGKKALKAINAEKLNEVNGPMLLDEGWTPVTVSYWCHIPSSWIAKNVSGDYKCFGHYWYFEKASDATLFLLVWQ